MSTYRPSFSCHTHVKDNNYNQLIDHRTHFKNHLQNHSGCHRDIFSGLCYVVESKKMKFLANNWIFFPRCLKGVVPKYIHRRGQCFAWPHQ